MELIADFIGIIGVVLVLVTYFLLSTNRMHPHSLSYPLLNFIGSCLILFSLAYSWNLASVLIEIAWILISALGVIRSLIHKKRNIK